MARSLQNQVVEKARALIADNGTGVVAILLGTSMATQCVQPPPTP